MCFVERILRENRIPRSFIRSHSEEDYAQVRD
jgi:hypothetical protein